MVHIQYLEIVTPDVDALCKQYTAVHDGLSFSEPDMNLGNARVAKLDHNGGGNEDASGGGTVGISSLIAIRGPLRDDEKPIVRPYTLVQDIKKAVKVASDSGAEIAIDSMEIPGGYGGFIAIVIQGGIECGFWQLKK